MEFINAFNVSVSLERICVCYKLQWLTNNIFFRRLDQEPKVLYDQKRSMDSTGRLVLGSSLLVIVLRGLWLVFYALHLSFSFSSLDFNF